MIKQTRLYVKFNEFCGLFQKLHEMIACSKDDAEFYINLKDGERFDSENGILFSDKTKLYQRTNMKNFENAIFVDESRKVFKKKLHALSSI